MTDERERLREALVLAHAELEDAREWFASRAEAPEVQERLLEARDKVFAALAHDRPSGPEYADGFVEGSRYHRAYLVAHDRPSGSVEAILDEWTRTGEWPPSPAPDGGWTVPRLVDYIARAALSGSSDPRERYGHVGCDDPSCDMCYGSSDPEAEREAKDQAAYERLQDEMDRAGYPT